MPQWRHPKSWLKSSLLSWAGKISTGMYWIQFMWGTCRKTLFLLRSWRTMIGTYSKPWENIFTHHENERFSVSGLHLCWWNLVLFSRLIVLRLLSSVRPSCLVLFAEELQESVRTCTVSIVIHKRQKDPGSVVLAVLPSRDLSLGLAELHAQAYCGCPEQSSEMLMREGEQLLIKFSGNITSTGS